MNVLEALMLICFGLSWPISIAKALRTKVVVGKSPLFIIVVILGYVFGLVNKLLHSADWVTYLYIINLVAVSLDLILYYRYRGNRPGSGEPVSTTKQFNR